MKISSRCFNIILLIVLTGVAGCKTSEERKKGKEATFIRLHLETNPDGTPYNAPVPVYRANPVMVNVQRDAVLDEGFMTKAELVDVDQQGGFAIKITFDDAGKLRLDNTTTSFKGRRLAVHARWTEVRWLAAPVITRRISDGVFVFTPDANRDEAERLVAGLNNVIKKLRKPYVF